MVIAECLISDGNTIFSGIDRLNLGVQAQGNQFFGVKVTGAQIQLIQSHIAQKVFFRQGRALVGGDWFIAN